MESPVYYGSSMYRVFTPGERLELEEVGFDDLQVGDVVVVNVPGQKQYVHRIIEKKSGAAVTMGDNNADIDDFRVTPQSNFRRVIFAVSADGARRQIAGGSAGMKDFYRHRRQRKFRLTVRKMLKSCEFLLFWRHTLHEKKVFGGDECFYWKSRAVARRTADGRCAYTSWRDFLRFRLPEDK